MRILQTACVRLLKNKSAPNPGINCHIGVYLWIAVFLSNLSPIRRRARHLMQPHLLHRRHLIHWRATGWQLAQLPGPLRALRPRPARCVIICRRLFYPHPVLPVALALRRHKLAWLGARPVLLLSAFFGPCWEGISTATAVAAPPQEEPQAADYGAQERDAEAEAHAECGFVGGGEVGGVTLDAAYTGAVAALAG